MADDNADDSAQRTQQVRTMQIIAGALVFGIVMFAAILVGVTHPPARADELPIVSVLAAGILCINAALAFIVPGFVVAKGARSIAAGHWTPPRESGPAMFATDANKLLLVAQTSMIVRFALLESCGMIGCVAYIVEGRPLVLAVPATAVLLMLLNFPTRAGVQNWLETQAARLSEVRQEMKISS